MTDYRLNDKVRILKLEQECGVGIVEGKTLTSKPDKEPVYKIAVRFNPVHFTKRGITYMRQQKVLNPSGRTSVIFLIPSTELVSVSTYRPEEVKRHGEAEGKPTRKARKAASKNT